MKRRLYYGFVVAGITFAALLVAAGVRATPGVLMIPLEREFGWSTATISAAIALNIALFGLSGPFAAALIERYGVRWTVSIALIAEGIAIAATAFVRSPWELVLVWGVCVGIATGIISSVLAATVATRWFITARGVILGLLSASVSTGQLVILPVLAVLTSGPGWRWAVYLVAGIAFAAAVPFFFMIRERPSDLGLPPYGGAAVEPAPKKRRNPIAIAMRELTLGVQSRDFLLIFATFFVCGASTNGLIGTHFIAACGDHNINEVHAAGLLAAMGAFDLVGTTASGWLSDRYDSRVLLFWYYGLRGLSLLALPFVFTLTAPVLFAFTLFYGLDWIATIPPTVRLVTQSFGEQRGPVLYGWIFAGHQLGASAIALLAGSIRTAFGSYDMSFWISGTLCICAALLALAINRRFRRPFSVEPMARPA